MKIIFLHGLGQTAQDWNEVVKQIPRFDTDCLKLFSANKNDITYLSILSELEKKYEDTTEPFVLCGISLGAILALDYTIRHKDKVSSLILIGVQYKVPSLIIDFQNFIFRCMPQKAFKNMGISKNSMIKLSHSMRSLDFTPKLKEITCPVTIICGEKDYANKKASIQLNAQLSKSKLYIIPNAGHEVNKSAPNEIAAILTNENS